MTDLLPDLTGRVALVAGASRGLGRALAEALGARGAEVIAVARTVGGLEELDDAIRAAGGPQAVLVPMDVTDDAALERLGAAVFERWRRLDLLVHATVEAPPLSPVEHIAAKDLDRCHAVTARSVTQVIRVADPLLRMAPAGRAAFFDDPHSRGKFHAAYASAKAAARVTVETWAAETAGLGLRVRLLSPPPMTTAVRARFHPGEDRSRLTAPRDAAAALLPAILAD